MRTPILVGELELTEPINDVHLPARDDGVAVQRCSPAGPHAALPVGYVSLSPGALDAASVAREVWRRLSCEINAQRLRHRFERPSTHCRSGASRPKRSWWRRSRSARSSASFSTHGTVPRVRAHFARASRIALSAIRDRVGRQCA